MNRNKLKIITELMTGHASVKGHLSKIDIVLTL